MHLTNWIEQNTTMGMSLELVYNYKIPFLNSVHIFSPVFCPLYMRKYFFKLTIFLKTEKSLMKIYTVKVKGKSFILIHYFKTKKSASF